MRRRAVLAGVAATASVTAAGVVATSSPALANGGAFDVKDFGAIGDGTTSDRVAIQKAFDAVPSQGGSVYLPVGTFSVDAPGLTIHDKSNFTLGGPGKLLLSGTGSVVNGYIGVKLSGTCKNITLNGVHIQGDGVASHNHAGVWTGQSAVLTNIRVLFCEIQGVVTGIQAGHGQVSTVVGWKTIGNHLKNIVGVDSGQGYGIVSSGAVDTQIIGNRIEGAQRHSIYISAGSRVVCSGNVIRDHRQGVGLGNTLMSALVIARTSDVVCTGNLITNVWDNAIEIVPDDDMPVRNVVCSNNVVTGVNAGPSAVWIGGDPAANRVMSHVDFSHNVIRLNSSDVTGLRLRYGKNMTVRSNEFIYDGVTAEAYGIEVACDSETAGTTLYSDHLAFEDNTITASSGDGPLFGVRLNPAACIAGTRMSFRNNKLNSTLSGDFWNTGAWVDNTNIWYRDQSVAGFGWNTGLRPSAEIAGAGASFWDTITSKMIFSNGAAWRYADGTAV